MKTSHAVATATLCALWSFSTAAVAGHWTIHQTNKLDVSFDIQQTGETLTGTGSYGTLTGTLTEGSIRNNFLDFKIRWSDNKTGKYTGHIDPDGVVRDGFTFEVGTKTSAKWQSTSAVSLGGAPAAPPPAGSRPSLSVEAHHNQLQNGFDVRVGGRGFRAGESVVIQARTVSSGIASPWTFFAQKAAIASGEIDSGILSAFCAGGTFELLAKGAASGQSNSTGFSCGAGSNIKSVGQSLSLSPKGVIYAVASNDDLLWYRHDGRNDGAFAWAFKDGKKVGVGWNVKQVFSGGDGVIYTISNNGDLTWYRHDGRNDGTFRWAFENGKKVGVGWNVKQVFSGGDGVIYTISDNGDLMWYRHDGRNDGTFRWAFKDGKKVGVGWNVKQVFSGGGGVIYTISDSGDLTWYRHDGRNDGTFRWAFKDGKKVGVGWNVKQVFSGGDGVIYTISDSGDLTWYRHDGRNDGTFRWAFKDGKKVGVGWLPPTLKQVFPG